MNPRAQVIGFVWDASDKRARIWNDEGWIQMFEQLIEYTKIHGNCLVPTNYKGNPKTGQVGEHSATGLS